MALGLTQPLTEMSTSNISWPMRRADNLTTFMCRNVLKFGSLNVLEPSGPVQGLLTFHHSSSYFTDLKKRNANYKNNWVFEMRRLPHAVRLFGKWALVKCRVWMRRGGCIGSWWGNRRESDHWGGLGVDG